MFFVDPGAGILTFVETVPPRGSWPRCFEIDPSGQFLFVANQNSRDIFTFRIDPQTGRLTPAGRFFRFPPPSASSSSLRTEFPRLAPSGLRFRLAHPDEHIHGAAVRFREVRNRRKLDRLGRGDLPSN